MFFMYQLQFADQRLIIELLSVHIFQTGGHDNFRQMQQQCVDEYNRRENLGPQKQAMLHGYLVSKETADQAIMNADNVRFKVCTDFI